MKSKYIILLIIIGVISFLFLKTWESPSMKEEKRIQKNTETLKTAKQRDILDFDGFYFLVLQNFRDTEKIELKYSEGEIKVWSYSELKNGYNDFSLLKNSDDEWVEVALSCFVELDNELPSLIPIEKSHYNNSEDVLSVLSSCKRQDLIRFNKIWYIVCCNYGHYGTMELQRNIKEGGVNKIYSYSEIVKFKDFSFIESPANDYSDYLSFFFIKLRNNIIAGDG